MIPLFKVLMTEQAKQNALEVLSSGYVAQGVKVEQFERWLRERALQLSSDQAVVTVNSGTSAIDLALHLSEVEPEDEIITSPQTCLSYRTPVLLADGTTEWIGILVNQRKSVDVVSFNQITQTFENKKVTGWVKVSSKDVVWYRIRCKNAPGSRGVSGKRGIFITGDHTVLTERGYVRVDELLSQDRIITRQLTLNSKQRAAIEGTLLGDASISLIRKGHSRFSMGHAKDQEEWIKLKSNMICGLHQTWFKRKGERVKIRTKIGEKTKYKKVRQDSLRVEVHAPMAFKELRERWYSVDRNKVVPDDLELIPITLATWYMDDGSYNATSESPNVIFCTEGFENESIWRLFWKLVDLGFKPRIHSVDKKPRLSLLNQDLKKFFDIVGVYVPPCMRYKLSQDAPPFDPALWELGTAEILSEEVIVEKKDPPEYDNGRFVFCLEVEDNHNFVVADMVVSNCLATNIHIAHRKAKIVWADVDPNSGLIDPKDVERKLTKKTKAIIAIDWQGSMCNYEQLRKIVGSKMSIIEDAAHAFGARWVGESSVANSQATYKCFSFQAIKTLTTCDGGAIVVPKKYEDRAKKLRWFGLDRSKPEADRFKQDMIEPGFKYHLNDLAASIGLGNGEVALKAVGVHRENAHYYNTRLKDISSKRFIGYAYSIGNMGASYWIYTIFVDNPALFTTFMGRRGITVSQVHTRNDNHSGLKKHTKPLKYDLKGVTSFNDHQVALPCGWWITNHDREIIANAVEDWAIGKI